MNDQDLIPCEWPKCPLESSHHIYYGDESIHVCRPHKEAVKINIETQDRIWIFQQTANKLASDGNIVRPGDKQRELQVSQDKTPIEEDWEKVAAKKADALAVPEDAIQPLVNPRMRGKVDEAISRVFNNKLKQQ